MKKMLFVLALFSSLAVCSQTQIMYVAPRGGLPLREKQDISSKALDKIPFGTKLTILPGTEEEQVMKAEGMTGRWKKTSYNGKTGYVNDIYLFEVPPPKVTVKDMKSYLLQLSQPFGTKLTVNHGKKISIDEMGYTLTKQLFKNGAEIHEMMGYEYGSTTYFIPDFDIPHGFVLLRMIPEFKDVFAATDVYPTESKTFTRDEKQYTITVDKENFGEDAVWVTRIKVEYEDGAVYDFEMTQIGAQLVVTLSSGV